MRRLVLLVLALLVGSPSLLEAQKRCNKGIPCGNTCISARKTCRIDAPRALQGSPAAPSIKSMPWVASSRGQTYYKRGCSGANKLAPANRIYFRSEADAQRAGYRRSTARGC